MQRRRCWPIMSEFMNKRIAYLLMGLLFASPCAMALKSTPGTEMDFSGTLVDEPCTVDPADTDIHLDFGTIIQTYLYLNTRTHSQPFTIHLQNCDIDGWTGDATVNTRFEGSESTELPGYLATSDASMGVAIGIEEKNGTFLGLGKNSSPQKLADGSVALTFQAYVEGEPTALKNQSITLGDFSATATFFLEYQ
ncbi:fimbrial protein [Klebsiella aerogenes]|uniref:fimbrial protein n=1 Tax=Klebsiella aerogenes TaxID=548 RepID=UPI002E3115B1|nr:fimbrial protein [Klebsiella aerogenes]